MKVNIPTAVSIRFSNLEADWKDCLCVRVEDIAD